ncbi:MAG: tRNA adenosine(34) deaminase TadA [Granulosicoccaceae bacterium]
MSDATAHEHWMTVALELANKAKDQGEVPVGAVVVFEDKLVGQGFNSPIGSCDPSAHAEIQALRSAARSLNNYRLPACTLYVTLEPCTMCVGALVHARIETLVYGAREYRTGAVESQLQLLDTAAHNHRVISHGGVLEPQCRELLQSFFRARRKAK